MVTLRGFAAFVSCAVLVAACWSFPADRYTFEGGLGLVDAAPDTRADAPADGPRADTTVDGPRADPTVDGPRADTTVDGPRGDTTADGPRGDSTFDAPDASVDATADATPCHSECTGGCVGGVCRRTCSGEGCKCPKDTPCILTIDCSSKCGKKIDCGAKGALACTINCSNGECGGELICQSTGPCTINCTGGSCSNKITCGQGRCNVDCNNGSCSNEIFCGQSCSCTVTCAPGSCTNKTHCIANCDGTGKNCRGGGACDTCP